jgi:toxin ParE1/3/4
MDFQVLIAESAIADLKEIIEFIAKDNPEAALRLGEKILAHALSLRTMPLRFPFHDKRRGIRKMPLQPFLIFYLCDETTGVVHILHFWHGARRSPQFARQ